jgi:ATP-binding cassette subfamily B protein
MLLVAFLFVTAATLLNTLQPFAIKQVIDGAIADDADAVVRWVLGYLAFLGVGYVCWRSSGMVGLHVFTRATRRGYNALFDHLIKHSSAYFSERFGGSLSSKLNRAVMKTEDLWESMLWAYYASAVQALVTLGLIALASPLLAALFLGLIVTIVGVNVPLVRLRRPMIVASAEAQSTLSGATVDTLSNISAVQTFAHHDHERSRVAALTEEVRSTDERQWRWSEYGLILNNVIIFCFVAAMTWLLIERWQGGVVSTGDLVMVFTLLGGMLGTLVFIGNMMNRLIRNYGEIEEGLQEVLRPLDQEEHPHARDAGIESGAITLSGVTFRYPGAPDARIFHDLSLSILPHERVGVVGHSGAGKSSLVALLLRQYEVEDGAILIDGIDTRELTLASVRRAIAFVPQDPVMFHRTIRENIRYGRLEASDEEVEAAARAANAHDFIAAAPEGFDTLVGERGVKLSGGQRQRIAIARAILKDAPILVLDEATSALDSESESLIQDALEELMEGKTVLAIAHRLSTLRRMDRILVFEQGRIVQDGAHETLVQQAGTYQTLWEHQAGGFLKE